MTPLVEFFQQMTDRILDVSEAPARLRVRSGQLIIERRSLADVSTPLAEVAVIVVSHPQVNYTQAVLSGLAESGGAFVACNSQHLPVGMFLPLNAHHAQTARFIAQAAASVPTKKRLWKAVVRAKIRAQAATLNTLFGSDNGLAALVGQVCSGDSTNVEAWAARRYWPRLFIDSNFRRNRDNEDQNLLLNYGYAVLRAIVARAICAAGLHPSLGIFHHNRSNAYCLADDLMEPFRSTVDLAVAEYMSEADDFLGVDSDAKRQIVGALTGRFLMGGELCTLFEVSARLAGSLADVFLGNRRDLELPDP